MKLKKLNTSGVAHLMLIAVVVVAVGIGGAAFVVMSGAQTPEPGVVQTKAPNVKLACSISAPKTVKHGESFNVSLTIRNGSAQDLTIQPTWGGGQSDASGQGSGGAGPVDFPTIPAHKSVTKDMGPSTASTDSNIVKMSFAASFTDPSMSCEANVAVQG